MCALPWLVVVVAGVAAGKALLVLFVAVAAVALVAAGHSRNSIMIRFRGFAR